MLFIISDFISIIKYVVHLFLSLKLLLHTLLINVMIKHKLFINNENKTYYINA